MTETLSVLERGPAANPLFQAIFKGSTGIRLPADRRCERLP
jgi:hypothetical protein